MYNSNMLITAAAIPVERNFISVSCFLERENDQIEYPALSSVFVVMLGQTYSINCMNEHLGIS